MQDNHHGKAGRTILHQAWEQERVAARSWNVQFGGFMKNEKMMKKRTLKTITLGDESGPTTSICKGHVSVREFNKAFKAEGWHGDPIRKEMITHEYWIKQGKSWMRSVEGGKDRAGRKAQPVTVMDW